VFVDLERNHGDHHQTLPDECDAAYEALVLGTRDYIRKCGFGRVLLGLSGGIDSSLTAAIAADAVGPENVVGVGMPGPFSSEGSVSDARALAGNLGIRFELAPITPMYGEFLRVLDPLFAGAPRDVTEENLQARLRGVTLMGLSNKWSAIVLTTGNKSELAVGYCTLYGDMCGGLSVINDVPKTLVYELARHRNASSKAWIPEHTLGREPTAELRAGQRDTDTLPPYEVLDPILKAYVEEDSEVERVVAMGYDRSLVQRVIRMVDQAEYKRRQAPPGIRITPRALGKDRRLPITNRHHPWRD